MASQYDVVAGLDLSSLTSVTQAQIMQAINQLAPLANIGGIIFQAGTSVNTTIAQGTGGSPDVTGNPRFARYIWLNTYNAATLPPTPYYYDASTGDWTLVSVAAGSIVNASVASNAAIAVTKLAVGTARYLLRTNAAGTALEFVAPASVNTTNEIPVNNLVANGTNGYLKTSAGSVVWVADATERAAIQSGISALAPASISPGANNTLMGTNGSGVVGFDSIGNILSNNAIGLSLLSAGGSAQYDVLYSTGTAWEKRTPSVNFLQGATINSGITVGALGGATVFTQAHGLGATPKIFRATVICTTIDNGFAVGDELDVYSIRNAAANNTNVGLTADATNITFTLNSAAGNEIPNKGTGTFAAMTETSWSLKVYAWK